MLNKVFLQGRLVADPELRHTQSGTAVATFRLAVDRDFKDKESGALHTWTCHGGSFDFKSSAGGPDPTPSNL